MTELGDYELKVLRAFAEDDWSELVGGAALNTAVGYLRSGGYLGHTLPTEKGYEVLKELDAENPRGE